MQKSVLRLICLLLLSVATVTCAQEPNPSFNQEVDQETPTQAKAEARFKGLCWRSGEGGSEPGGQPDQCSSSEQ
jgi:hypothetical protein